MKTNVGKTDKWIRIMLAIVLGALYYTKTVTDTLGIITLVVAGIFLVTAFTGICPLYSLFGVNTCARKSPK
jgi:hypothetical protein